MAYLSSLGGTDGNFAPADFGDADESAPTGVVFDIGGHGQATPYSGAVNAMITKQIDEIKAKNTTSINITTTWKRKLRDFMSKKNNELLDFLKLTVPHHPVMGPGEVLLRRFGNPQVTPTHPSVRDMVLDISGEDSLDDINATLLSSSVGNPLKDHVTNTHLIYELYKEAGDNALKLQYALKTKLDKLDRIQGKLSGLFEIEPNELFEPLMQANEAYLSKIFKDTQIEDDYKALIAAYRRFIAIRDIVTTSRTVLLQESEPLCSICLDESVAFALNPCGHTFCQTCIRKQTGSCFICRTPIKDRLKLYFG
jgi:hypothetical protein